MAQESTSNGIATEVNVQPAEELISIQSKLRAESNIDLTTKLMIFRTAYLQSLAACWSDKNIENKLISGEENAKDHCIDILKQDAFKEFLPNKNFNFHWNIEVFIIDTKRTIFLEDQNPFEMKKSANNGWDCTNDVFVIKIPKAPALEDRVAALAAYYNIFTTIFGENISDEAAIKNENVTYKQACSFFKPFEAQEAKPLDAWEQNVNNNMGVGGAQSFMSFSAVFNLVIAKCWEDEVYFENVIKNGLLSPIGTDDSVMRISGNDFANPWSFSIIFQKAEKTFWNNDKKNWENIESNLIGLSYPHKPNNPSLAPEALAKYNNTGPTYPLTC